MRSWLTILICTTILGACGSLVYDPRPVVPTPVMLTEDPDLKAAARSFLKDCRRFVSVDGCKIPHRITLSYFPAKSHPDLRGVAEMWGRGTTITEVKVGIADYLAVFKDNLKIVVYHELFHAMFQLEHDDSSFGIMNTSGNEWEDKIILADFDYYVEKEFNRVKQH